MMDGTEQTVQVASLPEGELQIGTNATSIDLMIEDIDVRDFVEAPDFAFSVVAFGTVPQDFVIIDPVIRFRVGVGIR